MSDEEQTVNPGRRSLLGQHVGRHQAGEAGPELDVVERRDRLDQQKAHAFSPN